jgi:hypothetical protein
MFYAELLVCGFHDFNLTVRLAPDMQWWSQKFAAGYAKYKKISKLIHNIKEDKL